MNKAKARKIINEEILPRKHEIQNLILDSLDFEKRERKKVYKICFDGKPIRINGIDAYKNKGVATRALNDYFRNDKWYGSRIATKIRDKFFPEPPKPAEMNNDERWDGEEMVRHDDILYDDTIAKAFDKIVKETIDMKRFQVVEFLD